MKIEPNISGEHIDPIEHSFKIDRFNYDFESTFLVAKKQNLRCLEVKRSNKNKRMQIRNSVLINLFIKKNNQGSLFFFTRYGLED
jgi:hypothetical protein